MSRSSLEENLVTNPEASAYCRACDLSQEDVLIDNSVREWDVLTSNWLLEALKVGLRQPSHSLKCRRDDEIFQACMRVVVTGRFPSFTDRSWQERF